MTATARSQETEVIDNETGELVTIRDDSAAMAIARSEVESQIDAAHKYPRSLKRFKDDALSMATISQEVAESCIYALPRGGKTIAGPSIRLAEVCASAWGNIHAGARVTSVGETETTCQGVCWDMQRNVRVSIEVKRRIVNKRGERFNDDMIIMTQNAASSIALRNAIFRVIPRAYVDEIYRQVKEVAVGNASTIATKRAKLMERLQKIGVDQARVLHALGVKGVEDIGVEQMELLIGYGTAIKDGASIDELFPDPKAQAPAPTDKKPAADKIAEAAAKLRETVSVEETEPTTPVATSAEPDALAGLAIQLSEITGKPVASAEKAIQAFCLAMFRAEPSKITPINLKSLKTHIANGDLNVKVK